MWTPLKVVTCAKNVPILLVSHQKSFIFIHLEASIIHPSLEDLMWFS